MDKDNLRINVVVLNRIMLYISKMKFLVVFIKGQKKKLLEKIKNYFKKFNEVQEFKEDFGTFIPFWADQFKIFLKNIGAFEKVLEDLLAFETQIDENNEFFSIVEDFPDILHSSKLDGIKFYRKNIKKTLSDIMAKVSILSKRIK